uniref:Uncharacterized protein n=2 Tax=Kalmanozyma brasiliensis (strain GHG001) TaxID=1365824 RepID=V5F3I2_KALBG
MPFAHLRDVLAGQSMKADDVLLLHAHGLGAPQARSSVDQLSEQLKALDVALFACADEAAVMGEASGLKDYLVAFSSKYTADHIKGVPPSLADAIGQPYTICVVPLQLDHHPAPSSQISFDPLPRLDSNVDSVLDAAIGKNFGDDFHVTSHDVRKIRLAAQRYGVTKKVYKDMRSKYNVIFQGVNPLAYERIMIYSMARIFEGGARLGLDPEKDAKLWKDTQRGTNIFVRRAAFQQMLSSDQTTDDPRVPSLAPVLRRMKRHPLCNFFLFGFSSVDPDERICEFFPGRSGLVTFTFTTILADLLRSSMASPEQDPLDKEEGQLTQTDKTPPDSILCNAAFHLADHWKVRIHPWVRTCFKLLADHLEPVCRALDLIGEDQEFPIELMLELDAKLETLYTSALCEEWSVDDISGLPFDEPTEVPDEPAELVKRVDDEVLATLRKAQMASSRDTRFHVLVSQGEEMSEKQLAGIEKISLNEFGADKCRELARLPGN